MNLPYHMSAGAALLAGGAAAGQAEAGVAAAATTVLVDIDHWIDFWWERGFSANVAEFFSYCNHGRSRTISIVLHGWEWCALAVAGAVWFRDPILGGAAIGLLVHLMMDAWGFRRTARPQIFSFIARARHRFLRDPLERVWTPRRC